MRNRLPPPPAAATATDGTSGSGGGGRGAAPIAPGVLVRLCAPQYRRLVLGSEDSEGCEYVQLMHCLKVRRACSACRMRRSSWTRVASYRVRSLCTVTLD